MSDRQASGEESGTDKQQSRQSRGQGAVYQGAFEAVLAIPIAGGIGYWLDGVFDTEPTLLLIGFAIGFASFTVRLIRMGRWVRGQSGGSGEGSESSDGSDGSGKTGGISER